MYYAAFNSSSRRKFSKFVKKLKKLDFALPEPVIVIVTQISPARKGKTRGCDRRYSMETITLNNGMELPVMGFGTYKMHGTECEDAVAAAIHAGCRLIDTAEAYDNEEAVGRGIAKGGVPRDQLILLTKVDYRSYDDAAGSVRNSLKNLGTDYLDLVLLHWPLGNYYAAWRTLETLYRQGVIRAIGVSNFNPDRLVDLIAFNEVIPAVDQIEAHLFCQRRDQLPWLEKYGVKPMAYAPLGRAKGLDDPVLTEIAKAHGKTPAQTALRYLIQRGMPVIPKSSREERIRQNLDVFGFTLTREEMDRLLTLDTGAPMIGNPESPDRAEALTGAAGRLQAT